MTKPVRIITLFILILTCAAAGRVAWLKFMRPPATTPRSLIIASNAPLQKSVHNQLIPTLQIERCEAYVQTHRGENLEPRAFPNASIEKFRRAYGQESKYTNEIREWEWQADDFNLQVWGDSDPKRVRSIGLDARPGHIITTPDGIDLRKDTFATLLQKMRDRGISVSEKMEGADGTWILFASFPSLCNADDWSEYSWYLNGTPAVDDAVGNSIPFRSNIFLQKVVENYSMAIGKESEGDIEGQPATHE